MATKQDIEVTLGESSKIEFNYENANTNDKVMFIVYCNGSAVIVKQSTAQGGQSGEIDIENSSKYSINLTSADIDKLENETEITHKVFVWQGFPQQPYDPLFFYGDVTVNPRQGQTAQTVFQYYSESKVIKATEISSDCKACTIPAGYKIQSIIIQAPAEGNDLPDDISIGTTPEGVELIDGADVENGFAVLQPAEYNTLAVTNKDIYVSSSAWDAGVITLYFLITKIF